MGGPAYEPIKGNKSPFRFPNSYAGKPLFYEWTRDYIKMMELNKQGRLKEIDGFAPFVDNPMDIEWGPDGSMYVLEYGDGYFAENPDAQLSKINYVRGNRSPIAKVSANPAGGAAPLTVQFSTAGTTDPDGDTLKYAWDFDGDGKVDSRAQHPAFTYERNGEFQPVVKVTDETKRTASADVKVLVGNQEPVVELITTPKPDDPARAVPVRSDDHLRGQDHRRPAGGLLEGHRGLHPRPRAARPPAVLDGGLHRHVHRAAGHGPRRRGEPERHLRRLLHRRRGPQRHRRGAVHAAGPSARR